MIFCDGTDFVEAARCVYHEQLEDAGLAQGLFKFSYHQVANLMDTSAFQSPVRSPPGSS